MTRIMEKLGGLEPANEVHMRLLLPSLLLVLSTACAADTEYTPLGNCEEGSCDDSKLELVEFCRVDAGLTWDCDDIDASLDLCDYDGNYRIGGGVVQIEETEGAVCYVNAISSCHELRVSPAGTHLDCHVGTVTIEVGFDGVPVNRESYDLCAELDHWDAHAGYFHDREFFIKKEGASCSIKTEAVALPSDEVSCHAVIVSKEGLTCSIGDNGNDTFYPFITD